MPNGCKCHAYALRGLPYCYFHNRLHSRPAATPEKPIEIPVTEDRSAIQLALADVLNALCSSRLDPKRAGLVLYGLQIASQNVDRDPNTIPSRTVHLVTQTSDGQELAPEQGSCTGMDDCSICDWRETCEEFRPDEGVDNEEDEDE